MNPLEEKIIERIKKEGSITFEAFMEMALYEPELGYYTSPKTLIGRRGDFYTSPHLHPIFGAMLGRQLIEMWMVLGKPSEFHAVEIGAGAGYLCKDIFDYLHKPSKAAEVSEDKNDFLESLRYVIVELNHHIEKRQKELLVDIAKEITWINSLKNLPHGIKGCIFSNELLDAFPVHIVEMEDELKEIYLTIDGKQIIEQKQDVSTTDITDYINQFSIEIPHGYRTEINLTIRNWLREIVSILSNGFLLTIDYGYTTREYYDEERSKGTLLCYHKHQTNEEPYKNIGEQDITAHVNFSSLKRWGEESGLKTIGCSAQGTYLIASGIDEVIRELYADSPDYLSEITKIKGLILPQGMGESHMVMIQYKGEGSPELRGFSLRNQKDRL